MPFHTDAFTFKDSFPPPDVEQLAVDDQRELDPTG
jgi:hypothetical protein